MEMEAAFEHVRLLLASGEDGEAVRVLESLLALDPSAQDLLLPVAATLLERGRPTLAIRLADGVLSDDPWSSPAHQVRVDALADAGDPIASVAAARDWIRATPNEVDAHLALSWAYLAVYDGVSAAEAAEDARDADPYSPIGWLGMAWVARLEKRWDDVDRWCAEAVRLDPGHHDAQVMRAEALAQLGHTAQARHLLAGVDEDGRTRALRRSLHMHHFTMQMAMALVVATVVLGVISGSWALIVVPPVTAVVVGRRLALRRNVDRVRGMHPATMWGAVAVAISVLWSALF